MPRVRKLIFYLGFITVIIVLFLHFGNRIITSLNRWINSSFCDKPISYRIGTIDDEFEMSKEELKISSERAANNWNLAYGKQIFYYDEASELDINLTFDNRQRLIRNINQIEEDLNTKGSSFEEINLKYKQSLANLTDEINSVNKEIEYWNVRGGAPKDKYEELEKKNNKLNSEIQKLNELATELNEHASNYNNQIVYLEENVDIFNSILENTPEMGLYTFIENKIDIFFYHDVNDLVNVLTHEMGHALGLEHIKEENSVMSPLSSNKTVFSTSDKNTLISFCENRNRLNLIRNDLVNWWYIFTLDKE